MMNKKGVQLALGTVITIIILLLVVVVIVVLIANATGKWNTGTKCISEGGRCVKTDKCPKAADQITTLPDLCTSPQVCCKLISSS